MWIFSAFAKKEDARWASSFILLQNLRLFLLHDPILPQQFQPVVSLLQDLRCGILVTSG